MTEPERKSNIFCKSIKAIKKNKKRKKEKKEHTHTHSMDGFDPLKVLLWQGKISRSAEKKIVLQRIKKVGLCNVEDGL